MRVGKFASISGVGTATVRKWIREGKLNAELRTSDLGVEYYEIDDAIAETFVKPKIGRPRKMSFVTTKGGSRPKGQKLNTYVRERHSRNNK